MNGRVLPICALLCAGSSIAALADEQAALRSLPPSNASRFELTGRVWPERVDQPHICLWKDDALAAVSITIDDNTAPDHAWWLEQSQRYDFAATWFVITSLVNDERPGYHGSWEAFRQLHQAGHDIQSHTITHVSPNRGFDPDDPAKNLDVEYGTSRKIIEQHVPGQRVLTLAFPGGSYQRDHTDPALAAEYYVAARGTAGQINPANRVDYRQTSSIGNGLYVEDPEQARNQLVNLIDPQKAYRPFQYRGWYVTHFHRVNDADKPRLSKAFAFLKENRTDIWTGLFREVALYGQERDTAKVVVGKVDDQEIRFRLTDDMLDDWYDFPLTIKFRLPSNWTRVQAVRGDRSVPVSVVERNGDVYALVQAVPDRGEVILQPNFQHSSIKPCCPVRGISTPVREAFRSFP
jgi:peptidoglycan/xylan/chitin deacetylase (PgdA/CDA1 family)